MEDNEPDQIKGLWSWKEDEMLQMLVEKHGLKKNWSVISKSIPGRSEKSCRLRWCDKLSQGHGPFTLDEERLIVSTKSSDFHGELKEIVRREIKNYMCEMEGQGWEDFSFSPEFLQQLKEIVRQEIENYMCEMEHQGCCCCRNHHPRCVRRPPFLQNIEH